jgi:hypothetical protein
VSGPDKRLWTLPLRTAGSVSRDGTILSVRPRSGT